jgi:hypothetical protein
MNEPAYIKGCWFLVLPTLRVMNTNGRAMNPNGRAHPGEDQEAFRPVEPDPLLGKPPTRMKTKPLARILRAQSRQMYWAPSGS